MLVLLGIEEADTAEDGAWLAGKIAKLRVFSDAEGKMNADLAEVQGRVLVVSQFTLHAATKKGNRPSFSRAASPADAEALYEFFCKALREDGVLVETGVFGARMVVELENDGPVTIVLDV